MRKVAPSVMVREQIDQALEQEQEDFLGRSHYERRRGKGARRGYRNGYEEAVAATAVRGR